MWCSECESIDHYFFNQTTFWLFVPTQDVTKRVMKTLSAKAFKANQLNQRCISILVEKTRLEQFMNELFGELNGPEGMNTKITTTQGEYPDLAAIARIVPAAVLLNRFKSIWLVDSVKQERYETWFQPLVVGNENALNSPEIYAYEGLFRMRDDSDKIVPPDYVFRLAENAGLLFSLDLVARRSAVTFAARAQIKQKVFINFNPSSIYDPSYCLRTTAAAIREAGLKPENVVFEITETHKINDVSFVKGILSFYRGAGFEVALDDIGSGYSGLNLLHKLNPDYIKIDIELIRDIDLDQTKQRIVKHLIQIAHENSIKVVAEGIEKAEEAQWLIEQKADLLQGYYFGKPRLLNAAGR